MLSHTFFTVGRKKASLTEAIFNCIKWTLRFFDKLQLPPCSRAALCFPNSQCPMAGSPCHWPSSTEGIQKPPRGSSGTACPRTVQGWRAVVQPGSLSPEKTRAWGATTITPGLPAAWAHASLLCRQPANACAQIWAGVQTAQAWGKVWFKCNLRLKISCRSTLGFLPTSCSGITFSHSPTAPNISSS